MIRPRQEQLSRHVEELFKIVAAALRPLRLRALPRYQVGDDQGDQVIQRDGDDIAARGMRSNWADG